MKPCISVCLCLEVWECYGALHEWREAMCWQDEVQQCRSGLGAGPLLQALNEPQADLNYIRSALAYA